MNEIKCFATHRSFWIDPQGFVRPCARYQKPMQHISAFSNFNQVVEGENYQQLRDSHNRGEWPEHCFRCAEDESRGFSSKRQFYQRMQMDPEKDFMIDISVGNFCNLKCRMCNPHNSTSWNSDYEALQKAGLVSPLKSKDATKGYILSQEDEQRLLDFLSTVKGRAFIELKGGEPLIMPQVPKLIKRMSELPNSKNIHLLLVTNGTRAPEWVGELSPLLGKVDLIVSIDGLNEVYDYIRGGGDYTYEECIENIRKLSQMSGVELRFNVVAQNLNAHQLIDIYCFLSQNFTDKINFITLSLPRQWRLNNMPSSARMMLKEDYIKRSHLIGPSHKVRFDNMFAWLDEETESEHYNKFLAVTKVLDRLRGQSLVEVAPHLIEP